MGRGSTCSVGGPEFDGFSQWGPASPPTDTATPTDDGGAAPEPDEGGGFLIAMVLVGFVVVALLGVGVLTWSNDR